MVKVSLAAVIFFILGVFAAQFYNSRAIVLSSSSIEQVGVPPANAHQELDLQEAAIDPSAKNELQKIAAKPDINNIKTPKTPFEFYGVLLALESSSANELKDKILYLGKDKVAVRNQVAWLLAGKYPDQAIDFVTTLMNRGDVEMVKILLQCVGQNHATLAWDWLNANENELDKIFNTVATKYEFKLYILNMLALTPDQKWTAYEDAQTLVADGPRKGDKYNLLSVAINAASQDPDDAINHAISGVNGKPDPILFNGAIGTIIDKDLFRAKDLILQNQNLAEGTSASKVAYNLMQNNQFNEAYSFVNSLTNTELKSSAIATVSDRAIMNGLERAKEFANSIASNELRYEAVKGMVSSMDVSGQPIKDQMALFDSTLQKVPVDKKSFDYAYRMRDWPQKNASEFNAYMNELRARDKLFADEVEKNLQYFQKK